MPGARSRCNSFIVSRFYAFVAVADGASDRGPVRVAATAEGVAAVDVAGPPEAFAAALARRGLVEDPARAGDARGGSRSGRSRRSWP